MTEDYIKVICDRCGKFIYVEKKNFPNGITANFKSDDTRWTLKDNGMLRKDLCPNCSRKSEELLDKFFEKEDLYAWVKN